VDSVERSAHSAQVDVVTLYPGSFAHIGVAHVENIVDLYEAETRAVRTVKELAVHMAKELAVNVAKVLVVNMAKVLAVHMVEEWVLTRTTELPGGRSRLLVVYRPSTG
jgi:hypothetical protein